MAQAVEDGDWGVLGVYSDGGADGAGTPAASTEYDCQWLVGGTDADSRSNSGILLFLRVTRVGGWFLRGARVTLIH